MVNASKADKHWIGPPGLFSACSRVNVPKPDKHWIGPPGLFSACSWLNARKPHKLWAGPSHNLSKHINFFASKVILFLMKYINVCQKWFSDLFTSGFPTFHILSIFANFFRIQIFWSFYLHKFHVSYIHTICLFSPTFWTRTGTYGRSKSLILTVFRKRFCIHFPLLD